MAEISIKELKKGSQAYFKLLVETFKNRIINVCYGFVHNRDDAEDITQEVFIEVYESVKYFNEESSLSTWIYRIAVNKSLDFLRKSKRKKRWAGLIKVDLQQKDETEHWFESNDNPHLSLENRERIIILNQAVETLPQTQKTAFTLHKYEDLSYKEIADILHTTIPAVESLMHRAKKNLQKKLFNYFNDKSESF